MLIKACLNGARDLDAHPALPLTPTELAAAAQAAVAAGAGAIHMHPRDSDGKQSLDPAAVGAAVAAVRASCPGIAVGTTTIFGIAPDPQQRAALVTSWQTRPDFVSVNFDEPGLTELCTALQSIGVAIEAGIDSAATAGIYVNSAVFGACLRVLIEPGEAEPIAALATVAAIEAVLNAAADRTPRLLHGQNQAAWVLLDAAFARGYDTRIGFEDTLTLPDGTLAADNAALIIEAVRRANK